MFFLNSRLPIYEYFIFAWSIYFSISFREKSYLINSNIIILGEYLCWIQNCRLTIILSLLSQKESAQGWPICFVGRLGHIAQSVVHMCFWKTGYIRPLTNLGLLVMLHHYWHFFRLTSKQLWPLNKFMPFISWSGVLIAKATEQQGNSRDHW